MTLQLKQDLPEFERVPVCASDLVGRLALFSLEAFVSLVVVLALLDAVLPLASGLTGDLCCTGVLLDLRA